MPTNLVVSITDPTNLDAWGLHPVPGGTWSAGSYAQGAVCAYGSSIYFANQQTSSTPGTDGTWTLLLNGGVVGVTLDANSFVPLGNLPITRGQGMRALRVNGGTGGVAWPGASNWLKIVENALGADEGDSNVIAFDDAFWPIGGAIWTFIQSALATGLGSFSSAQLTALQNYAIANR